MVIHIYVRVYTIILAWAVSYLINSFSGTLPWASCSNPWNTAGRLLRDPHSGQLIINNTNVTKSSVSEFWERRVLSISDGIEELGTVRWELLLCLLACWIACYFCMWKGVQSTGKSDQKLKRSTQIKITMENWERDQWRKKREYILASAGNMVGLGNVWRFPYLCFKNGGGVFLLPYCFFSLLCGLPLFLLETVIGQYTQEGAITCWTKICPLAQGTGYYTIVIQLYLRAYTIILAWTFFYLINSFRGTLPWASCSNPWNTDRCVDLSTAFSRQLIINGTNVTKSSVSEFWERRVLSISDGIEELGTVRWELLLCLLACWIACYFCIWKGVQSTGKVVYFTALFPYVMLVILLIRGLTLPGALQGVVYYLYPDVSRLADLQVWMDACSQVLFSYGVSAGTLITFGSFNKLKNNCCRDCLWLSVLNGSTSFVAGFVVFSTLGFMAQAQGVPIDMVAESGPGLAFIAFPQAIAMMPLPQLWAVCFFLMLLLLGIDTIFAGLEMLISSVIDLFPGEMRRPWRREIGLLIFCSICFIIQITLTTEGGVYLFELIDYYGCSGMCILFGSLIQCLAVGWAFGAEQMCKAVEEITGQRPWLLYKLCWRYFTPLLSMVGLICFFLNYQPLKSRGGYVYPDWSFHLGLAMALSSMVAIPIYATGRLCFTKGTLRQRLVVLWYPDRRAVHPEMQNESETNPASSSDI